MALTAEAQEELKNRKPSSLLDIGADDYWCKTLRTNINDFRANYHTDEQLSRTLDKIVNEVDGLVTNKEYNRINDSFESLITTVERSRGAYYKKGSFKDASDEEKDKLRELMSKVNDFRLILEYETTPEKEEKKIKPRINYQEPNGNMPGKNLDDFSNRLNYGAPKQTRPRIPNIDTPKYSH